jgi:hypothetical protein
MNSNRKFTHVTDTHASEGPHMHQQQVKAAISALDIFLTSDDGHGGQKM